MQNGIYIPKMFTRIGDSMKKIIRRNLYNFVLIVVFLCYSLFTHAIDNPDAPDYVSDFLKHAEVYEREIQQTTHTTQSYLTAYAAYEKFLDKELNTAYNQLMVHLNEDVQLVLRNSQLKWLSYRDKEFDFIARNWTAQKFGSSAVISRGGYRTKLIKDRTMILLQYLQNY
ncbi:hypothetical protein C7H79_04405 [Nitrosomonas supralitoralis]|uniref:Lysozyme inhibitor LprI-like N-terminal domain-containing protein n=2 Tax=Nitrosomonas supralitoralis TaxID=2116706 RepID=A0A2P7NXB5_9PROT|nr:hypothetical protein C7H79_04405 [Nitrosomonas supralitoralis]